LALSVRRNATDHVGMNRDQGGLEVLSTEECSQLLRSRLVGRIGLIIDSLPAVFPVNYVVFDDLIVIRTRRGSLIASATRNTVVAFEVDDYDPDTGAGWSVMVQGLARELSDIRDIERARESGLAHWLDSRGSRHFSVSLDLVSGRRAAPDDRRSTLHQMPVQSTVSMAAPMRRDER